MSSTRSRMIAVGLAISLSPLFGCSHKSCDEWYQDVSKQCCAGQASCAANKSQFDSVCKQADDKCGSGLKCSGTPNGASCIVECGCG